MSLNDSLSVSPATVAPKQMLVERVKIALTPYVSRGGRTNASQAALDACHAEEMRRMLASLMSHFRAEATAMTGFLTTKAGDSNASSEIADLIEALLAKLDGKP